MDQALKKETIPAGGIADFVMTDEQINVLEAQELKEQFGTNGIAQFSDVGRKMANFGRYGDDTVAHVETGELIVPRALIDKNPELKESIFNHLRELGVEDPERYVVGEVKNSVNPTTGLPEFFFKKIFKSISKIAKGVGKALKKAAPIIIPMALNYFAPGLGTVMSGALGAGIGTLVQGGSVKDAFKSAVLGGATGAVAAGFSGPKTGPSGFFDNIATDIGTGTSSVKAAFQGNFEPLQSTAQPSINDLFSDETTVSTNTLANDTVIDGGTLSPSKYNIGADGKFVDASTVGADATVNNQFASSPVYSADEAFVPKTTIGEKLGFKMPESFSEAGELIMPSNKNFTEVLVEQNIKPLEATKAQIEVAKEIAKKESPSFLRRFGPSLALATAAGAAGGMFDAPEEEEDDPVRTGLDVYKENPEAYDVRDLAVTGASDSTSPSTSYGFEYNPYLFSKTPFQTAAEGGEIFPRRVGGIMPDEGIPNKDSVRAMLMPGEFVMTTNAVKGLGGGDMNKGINNMYSVMRNLEQRGKAMA